MRLDTANRSFAGLVILSFIAYLAIAFAACVLVTLTAYRISIDGFTVITASGENLRAGFVFLALVSAGAAFGLWSLGVQLLSSRKLRARVNALVLPTPPDLSAAAKRTQLSGRVRLVDADDRFSFAYGAISPRVALSRGFLESSSEEELDAVLEHERYHVLNLDPLKVMLFRALLSTFFFIPALRGLRTRYIAGRELAADRRALEARGRAPLAGALIKVIQGPDWRELQTAAAIGGAELLDVRVAQLESGREPKVAGLSAIALLVSGLGLGVLAWSFGTSVDAYGGPAAVIRTTMPGMKFEAPDLILGALCPAPFVAAGLAAYGWLSWRARRELDTTQT